MNLAVEPCDLADDPLKAEYTKMRASHVSADALNYRRVHTAIGVDAWRELWNSLLPHNAVADGWQKQLFFWNTCDETVGDFFDVASQTLIGVNHSAKRAAKVWNLMEKCGELLPIEIEGHGEAFLLHVAAQREALDFEHSKFIPIGDKKLVRQMVLADRSLVGEELFRMKSNPLSVILSWGETEDFFREYRKNNLTGLSFTEFEVV